MSTANTVTGLYTKVLQRDPNAAELATWVTLLDGKSVTQGAFVDTLINSPEATSFVDPIIRVYQAVFGRVPEPAGLDFWVDLFRAGTPLSTITSNFVASPEFVLRYGAPAQTGTVTTSYIQQLYQNILGRAPDAAGFAFWLSAKVTPAQMLEIFSGSIENTARSEGPINTFLGNIAAGKAQTGSLFPDTGPITGIQLQLTDKADTLTGTPDADTIFGSTGNLTTLQAADVVNGGDGPDTYKHVHDGGAATVNPNFTSVENLFFENIGSGALTVSLINAPATAQVWMDRANGAGLTVTNAGALFTVGVIGGKANLAGEPDAGNDYTVQFKDALVSGTSDAVSVVLDGAKIDALGLGGATSGQFETLNINALAGASRIRALTDGQGNDTNQLKTITVEGAGSLKITDASLSTGLTTVDAAKNTGGVTLNAETSVKDITITGGSGNDAFTANLTTSGLVVINAGEGNDVVTLNGASAAALTATDVIKGGGGVDVLGLSSADADDLDGDPDRAVISEFETLRITSAFTSTVEVSKFAGITNLQLEQGNNSGTFKGLTPTVNLEYRAAADSDLAATTLTIVDATNTGQTDTVNLSFNADLDQAGGNRIVDFKVALSGIENVNVTTADRDATATQSTKDLDGYRLVTSNAGSLTNVTATGDRAFHFFADAGSNLLSQINASTLTGTAIIDASAANGTTAGVTILSGAGKDTLTGTNKGDSIVGGGADDIIDGGTGELQTTGGDILAGGDGRDTFVLRTSGFAQNVNVTTGVDKITDFAFGSGGDKFSVANLNGPVAADGTVNAALISASNIGLISAGGTGRAEILVLDSTVAALRFAHSQALNNFTFTFGNAPGAPQQVMVVYAATDGGDARMATATLTAAGDLENVTDVAVFSGVTTGAFASGFVADNLAPFVPPITVTLATAIANNATYPATQLVTVSDTQANYTGTSAAALAALTNVDLFTSAGLPLNLTLDQVNAITNTRLVITDPITVIGAGGDLAAASALLAAADRVDFIDATDNAINLAAAQANTAGLNQKLVDADVVKVLDAGASIAGLNDVQLAALTKVDIFDANDNLLTVTLAQANAITNAKLELLDTVTVSDTQANFAAASIPALAALTKVDIFQVSTGVNLNLTLDQFNTIGNGRLLVPQTITVTGTGAALAPATVALAGQDRVDFIDATDDAINLTAAQATTAGLNAKLTASDNVKVLDTQAAIQGLTPVALSGLTNVDSFDSNNDQLSLSVAQATAITNGKLAVGDTVTVLDFGVNIAALTVGELGGFTKVSTFDASDNVLSLTVAKANAITNAKLVGADNVTVLDTGANIAALSVAEITAFGSVDFYDATNDALSVSAAQFNAITDTKLTFADNVTAADTTANLQANLVALLGAANVDVIDSTDNAVALVLTPAQLGVAANLAKLVVGDTITASDTSADINGALAALLAEVKVDNIDSTQDTTSINMTAAQAIGAANMAKMQAGDLITVVDASGAIGTNIVALLAEAKVDVIDSNENGVAFNITATQATTAASIAKLVTGDTITVADTSALIQTNLVALLAEAKVDNIDSTEDGTAINITAAQAIIGANMLKLAAGDSITVLDTGANLVANITALNAEAKVDRLDASNNAVSLTVTQFNTQAGAGTKAFATDDVITINATVGTDTIADIDAGAVGGAADKVIRYTAGNASALAFVQVGASATSLDNTDRFEGARDTFTGFDLGGDKLNLAAFNLVGLNGATQFAGNGSAVTNGGYIIVQGDNTNATTFTANNAGTASLVLWDADATAGVNMVGVVFVGAVLTAADLILA